MFVDWGRETSTKGDSPLSINENGLEREGAVSKGLADTKGNAGDTGELAESECCVPNGSGVVEWVGQSFAEAVEKVED